MEMAVETRSPRAIPRVRNAQNLKIRPLGSKSLILGPIVLEDTCEEFR